MSLIATNLQSMIDEMPAFQNQIIESFQISEEHMQGLSYRKTRELEIKKLQTKEAKEELNLIDQKNKSLIAQMDEKKRFLDQKIKEHQEHSSRDEENYEQERGLNEELNEKISKLNILAREVCTLKNLFRIRIEDERIKQVLHNQCNLVSFNHKEDDQFKNINQLYGMLRNN